jgi:hypothetical protein
MLDGYPTSCDDEDDEDDDEDDDDEDKDEDDDEEDEELIKYENAFLWQLSLFTVSLIGFLISII